MNTNISSIYIITGISGAGKTTALKAFEDLDYYCVDNIPTVLLPNFIDILQKTENIKKIAIGVDIRERFFLDEFENIYIKLKQKLPFLKIIFIDCEDFAIIKRFKETRRLHPLKGDDFFNAIKEERKFLANIKQKSDFIINTTDFNIHQLKNFIFNNFGSFDNKFNINLISFGFKYGILYEADYIFDARFIINPFFEEKLKYKTGEEQEVIDFIFNDNSANIFCKKIIDFIDFVVPPFMAEGKNFIIVGIGCTGGKHRSVAIVNKISELSANKYNIHIKHRDLEKD